MTPHTNSDRGRIGPLQRLQGLIVETVVPIHDYIQLRFAAGPVLSIYNNHSFSRKAVHLLQGRVLTAVVETEDKITFTFDDESQLFVGMLDKDFHGPEAMGLHIDGEPLVVWS